MTTPIAMPIVAYTTPICPDCMHPVNQHSEFFCLHIECKCNQGQKTALAKYDCAITSYQLNIAMSYLQKEAQNTDETRAEQAKDVLHRISILNTKVTEKAK